MSKGQPNRHKQTWLNISKSLDDNSCGTYPPPHSLLGLLICMAGVKPTASTKPKGQKNPIPPTKSRKPTTKKAAAGGDERFAALQDKNAELEKQIISAQAALAKEKALREAVEKAATTKKTAPRALTKIPKPKGSAGNGFKLIDEMNLQGNQALYNSMLREIAQLSIQAGLDYRTDFKNQPAAELGLVYKLAREMFPTLEQFANDWPTAEIVKQYLYNKRKNSVKKGYIPPRAERLKSAKDAGKVAIIHERRKSKATARVNKENVGASQTAASDGDEDDPMGAEQDVDGEEDDLDGDVAVED
ncbi:hypothetical protein B0H21DRAFT_843729 [Amylocystis lapponica]|nr:hypothetical protein B0H21DRAFT_843729 [Amylocystis lapponica]